jgi:ORF6N domain
MPKTTIIPVDAIAKRIVFIRGQRVILDTDLAELYGVSTTRFNQQVRRNIERFPEDFMFQLTKEEHDALILQFATSKSGRGGRRKLPLVFTEAGALNAASVLKSPRAIQVGIYVHRAFVQLRDLLATHKNIARQLTELEKRVAGHDKEIAQIVAAIHRLLEPPPAAKKRPIGFHTSVEE